MTPFPSSGSWNEERLYVLRTLEEIREEQKKQIAEMIAERAALLVKAQKDIQAAHDKIRTLESAGSHLKTKNWIMGAALSGIGVVIFELAKYALPLLLHGSKP